MKKKDIKILLVDDEPDILEIVSYNLSAEGYEVFTAKNGVEAVAKAKKKHPHLIILDVMMPEMDGIEACEIIRSTPGLQNTIITFSDDVKIEGKDLAAGAYGLHMAIYEDGKATVIFSKNTSSWGSYYYDKAEDALRVDVISEETAATELLTYDAVGMDNNSAILAIKWEKKMIPFKVEFDVTNVVLSKMRDDLRSTAGFGWQGLNQAANFCVRNQINQEEALTWVDRSIANNKNFNNMATKSALLKQMGKTEEATKMEAELVAVASMGELNNLGHQKLGQKDYDAAIKYFSLNTKRNPKNANCWDSLGEAYKTKGDKNNAIKSFKKSLSLDPPANVKSNSILLLKELGVDTKSYES